MFELKNKQGYIFRYLMPVFSPAGWLAAYQEENALNGYALTSGTFSKGPFWCSNCTDTMLTRNTIITTPKIASMIEFQTGEIVTIHYSCTLADDNTIKMELALHGQTPEIPAEYDIQVEDYYKEFIQVGERKIHAYSSQMFLIDGNPFPYR